MHTSKMLILVLAIVAFIACEDGSAAHLREERRTIQAEIDSLRATGQHGYYPVLYYVGRFKVSRLKKYPLNVEIHNISDHLLDKPISLTMIDSIQYEVSYRSKKGMNNIVGQYGIPLRAEDIELNLGQNTTHQLIEMELRVFNY